MEKIQMKVPLVEMDGDEMTRVLWKMIKEELLLPFVDLKTEYYDLGLLHRNETEDQVTVDAALAAKRLGVAVKCATITPNEQRMQEYPQLTKMWPSPNGTIRAILDGTVFRVPIKVDSIPPVVHRWEKPITIARHVHGDIYRCVDARTEHRCTAKLLFENESATKSVTIQQVEGPAIWMEMYNTEQSIRSFADACFSYAIDTRQDLWFATKDTIAKQYDGAFKRIFEEEYRTRYEEQFKALGITYFYTLIDDAAARVIRSRGGFIWACKNYDGDVMSDMISAAFGSLAMMTSVLVSPDGTMEYEAAHGTVTRHYYRYLQGEETSTNPLATLFAWTGALRKRGQLDQILELEEFAEDLEQCALDTLRSGIVTKDLVELSENKSCTAVTSAELLREIRRRITEKRRERAAGAP